MNCVKKHLVMEELEVLQNELPSPYLIILSDKPDNVWERCLSSCFTSRDHLLRKLETSQQADLVGYFRAQHQIRLIGL